MSFVNFKMALARFTIFISLLLYEQGTHGQQSSLMNEQSIGDNSLNHVFQSNPGRPTENFVKYQNGNSATLATNLNNQGQSPVNFQSVTPQSTISTQSTLALQQPQGSPALNLQLSQVPNYQHAITVQPSLQFDSSYLQKSQNLPQQQNVYKIPLNIQQGKQLNSQQQLPIASPIVQQAPVQSSPGIAIPKASFTSSFPSVSAIPNYPCQRNNLGTNYLPSTPSVYPILPPQTSYSSMPVMTILSSPTPIPLITQSANPYGNQAPDIIESPLRISNNFFIDDEENNLNQDSLTSVLLSLLQSPKKNSKSTIASGYLGNPYLQSYLNQGSKSSSIKSLLPLIVNILNEKREGCRCHEECQNCEQNWKAEPEIYDGYSKRKNYSLRDEMFQRDRTEEEIPRMIRAHKKSKKLKNSIPNDSCEDEDADYADCSEEED